MRNHLIYIGIILLLIFLLFDGCNDRKYDKQADNSVNEYLNDTIDYYENKIGQDVAHRKAINGSKESLEILLSKQIDSTQQLKRLVKGFNKVNAAGNITQITKIDSLFVPYKDVINNRVLGGKFSVKSKYYSIHGSDQIGGILIDNLEIPNTLSFAVGKTKGFFNNEYRIEAVNSNPKIKNTGLDSYTFKPKPKRIGIGLQVGYGIGTDLKPTPFFGIGVSYNFIRF